MQIDPSALDNLARYQLVTRLVIPRPIGWVSTNDSEGRNNLAPFSFFGAVSSKPPTLMLSVGRRRGERKDTANNLLATGEAVVHIPHRELAEKMVLTAAEVGPEVNETTLAALTPTPSVVVSAPRVAEAAVAMETKLLSHQEIGDGPMDMFLLEVVMFHIEDEYIRDGQPAADLIAAVGRLGGADYCDTGITFQIERP